MKVTGLIVKTLGQGYYLQTTQGKYKIHQSERDRVEIEVFGKDAVSYFDDFVGKQAVAKIENPDIICSPLNSDGWVKHGTLRIID
jgi:hypothetical protein